MPRELWNPRPEHTSTPTQEKGADLNSIMIIDDPRHAGIFTSSRKRRLLLSFVKEARSVSQAASAAAEPLPRVHFHVTDLHKRGFLFVEREEKRAGKPVRYYRASAKQFVLPSRLLSGSPGAGLAAELRACLDGALLASEDHHLILYTDPQGDPRVSWFSDPIPTLRAAEYWQILRLSDEKALDLSRELQALLLKYQQFDGGSTEYLIHAAVAPRGRN